jgi:outer membrane protein TolC
LYFANLKLKKYLLLPLLCFAGSIQAYANESAAITPAESTPAIPDSNTDPAPTTTGAPELSSSATTEAKTPSVPTPLAPSDLESIFISVTGGSGSSLSLDIPEMVRMALSNNSDIKIQRLAPELGQTDIRRALGLFDPQLAFSSQYAESETPQNAQQYIATGGQITQSTEPRIFSSQDYDMRWQLGGLTPLGTQYSLNFNQQQARNDINIERPPSLFYPEYTSVLGLSLSQPLLKNFGPDVNLAGLRIARIQKKIGWYDWQKQMINSLSEALYRYFDLVYAHENMRVRKEAVEASRLLEQQNIQRVIGGKMRPSDVWEAQASLSNNVDLALRSMNSYIEAQNSLKSVIFTDKMAESGSISRIIPESSLEVPTVAIDRSQFIYEAISSRPEYLNIVSKAEQEGIRVRYAKNQSYPTVNLVGNMGLTGLEGEYGTSLSNAMSAQGTNFSVGVLVSIPLGNIEGRANLDAAKLREKQAQIAIQKAITAISIEVDTAVSLLATSQQQVIAARDTALAARKTATAEEKLLEEGKATTFEVVRLQSNAAESQSRELASIAAYRKNVVRLAVSRGKLLNELGISLQKEALQTAMPSKKNNIQLPQSMQNQ